MHASPPLVSVLVFLAGGAKMHASPSTAGFGSCVPRGRGWTRAPRGRGWIMRADTGVCPYGLRNLVDGDSPRAAEQR